LTGWASPPNTTRPTPLPLPDCSGSDDCALLRAEQGSTDLSEGTILGALFEHLAALSVEMDDEIVPAIRGARR
jgi:hypothetical protein